MHDLSANVPCSVLSGSRLTLSCALSVSKRQLLHILLVYPESSKKVAVLPTTFFRLEIATAIGLNTFQAVDFCMRVTPP